MRYDNLCTWAEIDFDAILNNFELLSSFVGGETKKLAVIKADAYGHGAVQIAKLLDERIDYFGVARADEGVELREFGIKSNILILGHTAPAYFSTLIKHSLVPTIYNVHEAEALSCAACDAGVSVSVHVAVDTGMSRLGFATDDESINEICSVCSLENIEVSGIFSHLANADDLSDNTFTEKQVGLFKSVICRLEAKGINIPIKHLYNSAGLCSLDDDFDMVRMGICLYGHLPDVIFNVENIDRLSPVMSLRSEVIHVHEVEKGTSIGYNCTFVADKKMKIATVSAGYADGYPRAMSGRAEVIICGKKAKIVGRVCMDQFMCDVSHIENVEIGSVVTLFGKDGESEISASELACLAGTNTYEILCGISKRVPRVYYKGGIVTDVHFGIPHDFEDGLNTYPQN